MLSPDRSPQLLVPGRDRSLLLQNQYWEVESDNGWPSDTNPKYVKIFRQHWIKRQFFPHKMRPMELYELNWGYRQRSVCTVPRYEPHAGFYSTSSVTF